MISSLSSQSEDLVTSWLECAATQLLIVTLTRQVAGYHRYQLVRSYQVVPGTRSYEVTFKTVEEYNWVLPGKLDISDEPKKDSRRVGLSCIKGSVAHPTNQSSLGAGDGGSIRGSYKVLEKRRSR